MLAFYPRDFTSGCTAEMRPSPSSTTRCSGPTSWSWASAPIRWQTHTRFAASLNLPFRLLSDPTAEVARQYASNDRSGLPAAGRSTSSGRTARCTYRNLRFNALDPKHYSELGAAVRRSRGG